MALEYAEAGDIAFIRMQTLYVIIFCVITYCKRIKYRTPSLVKLGKAPLSGCRYIANSAESLRSSSVEKLLDISSSQARASTVAGLSLYSKLNRFIVPKFG